jgi:hypothetical protein
VVWSQRALPCRQIKKRHECASSPSGEPAHRTFITPIDREDITSWPATRRRIDVIDGVARRAQIFGSARCLAADGGHREAVGALLVGSNS